MTLDPRVSLYLNLAVISFGGIATYLMSNSDFVHSPAGFYTLLGLGGVIAAMNAILHAIPSQNTPEASKQFYLGPKT